MSMCLSLLAATLLLNGCGTPETHYYVLDPDRPPATVHVPLSGSIAITQIEIPQYLDRPRMVSRDDSNALRIAEYYQWGGRLRDNIVRTLADDLAARIPGASVVAVPMPGATDAEYEILLDIRQFERLADGHVHLRLNWHLRHHGSPTDSHHEHLVGTRRIDTTDYAAMAKAMSELLARLADLIAARLAENAR